MTNAPHGPWCGTQTWPTKCPSCREEVFFFSCLCGSKVFFDSLGFPWPEHSCGAGADVRPQAVPGARPDLISTESMDPRFLQWRGRIDERVASSAKEASSGKDQIVAVAPCRGAPHHRVGVLREVTLDADPFRAFKTPRTAMGMALLGPLGNKPVSRVTMHVYSVVDDEIESYTVWLPRSVLAAARVERGMTVDLRFQMRPAGTDHVWWARQCELVQKGKRAVEEAGGA